MVDKIQQGVRYMIETNDGRTILGTGEGSSRVTRLAARASERSYAVRDESSEHRLLIVTDSEIKKLTELGDPREPESPFARR